jgi:hypothetical protein
MAQKVTEIGLGLREFLEEINSLNKTLPRILFIFLYESEKPHSCKSIQDTQTFPVSDRSDP